VARRKKQSGTWVQRDLLFSRAFWSLSGTAKGMLLLFLMKRRMDKKHNILNARSIIMTYKELEHIFDPDESEKIVGLSHLGCSPEHPSGLSRASIN
jgi:hypothetical protein